MPTPPDQPDALPDTDQADLAVEQNIPAAQVPMDDAAGGPSVDPNDDRFDEEPDALQVQGGE